MIYELSHGKWGPLISLTLQDVVTYHRVSFLDSMAGASECFHSPLPLPPPANTDFYPFPSIQGEFAASLSHQLSVNSRFKSLLRRGSYGVFS